MSFYSYPQLVNSSDLAAAVTQRRNGHVVATRCLPQFAPGEAARQLHLDPVYEMVEPSSLSPMHNVITDSMMSFFNMLFANDQPELQEIVVTHDNYVIDGHQRHRAAVNAGMASVPIVRLRAL
jgi:hypothetical protein